MYQAKDKEGKTGKMELNSDLVNNPDILFGAMDHGLLTSAEARLILGLPVGEMTEITEAKNVITKEL